MNLKDDICLSTVNLLVFSVFGVHFGVDVEQVAGIADFYGESSDDLFWFHEQFEYGDAAAKYSSPVVVTIKTGGAQAYRIIIDSMIGIHEYQVREICLFPPLIKPFALRKGMWGLLVENNRMILLVDFQRLSRERETAHDTMAVVTKNESA